jgi:hypothetical protein
MAESKLILPAARPCKKKAAKKAETLMESAHDKAPSSPKRSNQQGKGGGRKSGGKLITSPTSGRLRYSVSGDEKTPTAKRQRSGAKIEASFEGESDGFAGTPSNLLLERYEKLKAEYVAVSERLAALESCTIAYVEQMRGSFHALESQRSVIVAFLPNSGSLPAAPTMPAPPAWYNELFYRKQSEVSALAKRATSSVSLDFA